MKKALIIFSLIAIIYACNNSEKGGSTDSATTETTIEDPEAEKGLALVAKSDCFTCHKVADASVGPAYEAVAARYPKNDAVVDSLAGKILHGGAGNWGSIPMTPHPDLSEDDAKSMVRYILSLK
jgi:cytochrome c